MYMYNVYVHDKDTYCTCTEGLNLLHMYIVRGGGGDFPFYSHNCLAVL